MIKPTSMRGKIYDKKEMHLRETLLAGNILAFLRPHQFPSPNFYPCQSSEPSIPPLLAPQSLDIDITMKFSTFEALLEDKVRLHPSSLINDLNELLNHKVLMRELAVRSTVKGSLCVLLVKTHCIVT